MVGRTYPVIVLSVALMFVLNTHLYAARIIKKIAGLSHKSGKIGIFRALIIGIQNYNSPKIDDLKTSLKDAPVMADILKSKYRFQVEILLGQKATKRAIAKALRNISSKAKPGDSVLIYYAGHGDFDRQYDSEWWIPADAKKRDSLTYLDNTLVQRAMKAKDARHVLLISDSCYSGALFGQERAMSQTISDKYYLNLNNEISRWGMTSGNKTSASDKGTDGHSVFAYQLIKKLKNNIKYYIYAQEIYTDIAPIIGNNSEQAPMCRPIKNTEDQGGGVGNEDSEPEEPIVMPQDTEMSFEDLKHAEQKKKEYEIRWANWQQKREKDFNEVKEIDNNSYLSSTHKKET